MRILKQKYVAKADLTHGEFNNCEHLFIELEAGKWQTVSCRLPNGKYVTFAFGPEFNDTSAELKWVDIHSTVGRHWTDEHTFPRDHWQQHLAGLSQDGTVFDTSKMKEVINLTTLLLHKKYHETRDGRP